MRTAARLLAPWQWLTSPRFYGLDNVPVDGPALYVGNHTIAGVLDAPLMWLHLYEQRGIVLRSLGDHFHFAVPLWRDALRRYGVVDGTRENCARLFEAGEHVLVFPGGGREVSKRKGEKYRLIWKNRLGFARMAIRHGVPIVPLAAVGAEEMLDIIVDANDILSTPIGRLVQRLPLRTDMIFPVVRGVGPLPLPRPERLFFRFGAPIDTSRFGRDADEDACRVLRDEVRAAVEEGIRFLQGERDRDPGEPLLRRAFAEAMRRAS